MNLSFYSWNFSIKYLKYNNYLNIKNNDIFNLDILYSFIFIDDRIYEILKFLQTQFMIVVYL